MYPRQALYQLSHNIASQKPHTFMFIVEYKLEFISFLKEMAVNPQGRWYDPGIAAVSRNPSRVYGWHFRKVRSLGFGFSLEPESPGVS